MKITKVTCKHKYLLAQQDFRSYPSVKHIRVCENCGDRKEEWIGQEPKFIGISGAVSSERQPCLITCPVPKPGINWRKGRQVKNNLMPATSEDHFLNHTNPTLVILISVTGTSFGSAWLTVPTFP